MQQGSEDRVDGFGGRVEEVGRQVMCEDDNILQTNPAFSDFTHFYTFEKTFVKFRFWLESTDLSAPGY